MHTCTVPIALHWLGLDRDLNVELFASPIQQVTSNPKMVAYLGSAGWADLEFPLAGHDLGVGAGDLETSFDAPVGVQFDQVAPVNLESAYAAVVRPLWCRETVWREARWPTCVRIDQGVFLLEAEPWLLVAVLVLCLACSCTSVGRDWRSVDVHRLAHHKNVVATTDWIVELCDGLENDVALVTWRLVGTGAVVAPGAWLFAVGENFGLGSDLFSRLGAVDPNVFGSVNHPRTPWLGPVFGRGHALRLDILGSAAMAITENHHGRYPRHAE